MLVRPFSKKIFSIGIAAALTGSIIGCGTTQGTNKTSTVQGNTQQLVVAGYGGSFETGLDKSAISTFEQEYHCHITYIPGPSTTTLAKLEAEKKSPQIDVAIMDDGPQAQADQLGLFATLDTKIVTNLNNVYSLAKIPGNVGVGIAVTATGLAYNTKVFAQNHWKPLNSWKDLSNPELKGELVLPSITNTYGVHMLVMEAKVNGGSVSNITPGFTAMKQIAKSTVTFDSTADVSNYFLQGTAVASVWGQGRVNSLKAQGFPIEFVFPKAGAVALFSTANVVKNAPDPKLAQEFVNYLLEPTTQAVIAKSVYMGPTNKTVSLPSSVGKMVIYGKSDMSKLVKVDWPVINANRAKWTTTWDEQIATQK